MENATIHAALTSQYLAALETLRLAISACPAALWEAPPPNLSAFWRVAHHTLWFADLYVSPSQAVFQAWSKHVDDHQHIGRYVSRDSDAPPKIGAPTTQPQMLEFVAHVMDRIAPAVTACNLDGESGFFWLKFSRFEAHIYNIRHIQHHTAHLVARLREHGGISVDWVGKFPRSK